MATAKIFDRFAAVESVGDGLSTFDFLGVATSSKFRKGWEKHASREGSKILPGVPPVNEHYLDWILTLEAVARASGTFRMAELGAGWGTWSVRAAAAAHQNEAISEIELLAVEADKTHFDWMVEHFKRNGLDPDAHHLLFGAVAPEPGEIRFPVVENPDENYGASIRGVYGDVPYVTVKAYTLPEILGEMSGPVDFLHVDMQGAEYDVMLPEMALLKSKVRSVMVGTHLSMELHDTLAGAFHRDGWVERMNYPRMTEVETEYGSVAFGDGLISFLNPALADPS